MLEIVDRIPAPVLLKDWPGNYVVSKRKVSNWLASCPEGTIFKLSTCTINKHLTSDACPCCGVSVKITYKGSMQEFLYDFDFIEVSGLTQDAPDL